MSRKGVTTICKSKQIPRIFQRRNQSVYTVGRTVWESVNNVDDSVDDNQRYATAHTSPDYCENERKQSDDGKRAKQREDSLSESIDFSSKSWNICCQGSVNNVNGSPVTIDSDSLDKNSAAAETVADIEKWLKTRTESVSSMDLGMMKSVVEEEDESVGVECYLADDLPHTFLGKDPDGLSIDIDLSDKKLNLGYDPILQELQSDKLLEACEKTNDFVLPEFRLDHLDPIPLSPAEMMVAGEILPSTSNQLNMVVENHENDENLVPAGIVGEIKGPVDSETRELVDDTVESSYETKEEIEEIIEETEFKEDEDNCYVGDITGFVQLADHPMKIKLENELVEHKRSKSKLKPRIIKRSRQISNKMESNRTILTGDECHIEGKDSIMAVVAISTDKISNMTQIVINNGREEQIYQGKTSELIEATGNFPKLPRIDAASGNWNNGADCSSDGPLNSQNETMISNALEELGITDECLQPTSISENGRIWLCPRDDCNREFTKLHALKGHLLAHYGVRPFKCDFQGCAWAFHSEFKLKRHKETHLKRKDFVCEVPGCNRRFTTVYNLWSHKKLHTRPNRIICQVPDCQEKFQTKRALELHMKTHDQSHAPYVCNHDGCGKRYYSSNALTSHQRCHSYKEIDVKCSWSGCGKVFDKPCRLKAHIRSHTGCKPYCCTYQDCQWAFSSSSKLKRHEKKHTNERKFICDVSGCGKAFMRSEHLKEHSLTHKEGRYFECYMCDARFSAKSSLYVHIKKHQVKEAVDTITRGQCKVPKRRINESQPSRENYATKVAVNSGEATGIENLYENSPIQNTFVEVPSNEESLVSARCFVQSPNDILSRINTHPDYYICGVEECSKSYKTQSTLRDHILAIHGNNPIEDGDKSSIGAGEVSSNMDYILYTPNAMVKTVNHNQMVMIEACDTISTSDSPENVECLPEPEPPPLDSTSRLSQSSYRSPDDDPSFDQRAKRTNQGSARTGLTRADVWKLKANATETPPVGASDVVLGTADLTEGLLLTEELPSMYYQDDMVGSECQILMLDSGTSENAIHLRGLE